MAMQMVKQYEAADFSHLLGMEGFSDALLNNHFTLYQGYVKNTNLLLEKMDKLAKEGKDRDPEFAELKRRFGFEFDGVKMHRMYFENLGGEADLDPNSELYRMISERFGSFDAWKKDFKATGAIRGVGWAVLYYDRESGNLINSWINEHHVNHLVGCVPILIMDVWEHAFMIDYGLNRADYIEAFFSNINWEAVARRIG